MLARYRLYRNNRDSRFVYRTIMLDDEPFDTFVRSRMLEDRDAFDSSIPLFRAFLFIASPVRMRVRENDGEVEGLEIFSEVYIYDTHVCLMRFSDVSKESNGIEYQYRRIEKV